jgi:hypothetical protein
MMTHSRILRFSLGASNSSHAGVAQFLQRMLVTTASRVGQVPGIDVTIIDTGAE